ncbi:extracellular solute-binding protein [Seminavis robusta]|uniref:Extracellular solute-binding protein n=1 Tax=Seminavis robusta TaxID=568900 RepID=A0A9N8DN89_9STRA|nr:extracellular solute-binding protein [Seminavis robusta]|eukprot:Sro255_g100400.1 extracellular solute-binding protein (825) ;mRNA; r:43609-46083
MNDQSTAVGSEATTATIAAEKGEQAVGDANAIPGGKAPGSKIDDTMVEKEGKNIAKGKAQDRQKTMVSGAKAKAQQQKTIENEGQQDLVDAKEKNTADDRNRELHPFLNSLATDDGSLVGTETGISQLLSLPMSLPEPAPPRPAEEGRPGAFAVRVNPGVTAGSESPSRNNQSHHPRHQDPTRLASQEPYTATARLVTDQDNADRLRAELEQIRSAPTAEVVSTEEQHKWGFMTGAAIVLATVVIIAFIVMVIMESSTDNNTDTEQGIHMPADVDLDSLNVTTLGGTKLLKPILKSIKDRGFIRCWVNGNEIDQGHGLSLELCSALSAAIFNGDPNKTSYSVVAFQDSWANLDNLTIDVVTAHITFNMRRDVYEQYSERPKSFSVPWYFTGVLFAGQPDMVDCAQKGDTLTGVCRDLVVCVYEATTTNDVVQAHLDGSGIHLLHSSDSPVTAFAEGTCNVIAAEPQELSKYPVRDAGYTGEFVKGPKLLSMEPLAMVTTGGDPQWTDFVNSVLQAFFTAELEGITQQTASLFPKVDWFGEEYQDMYHHAIAAVGNWGEIFNRTLALTIPRTGQNLLVRGVQEKAGLLYSPPLSALSLNPALQTQILPQVVPNGTLQMIGQRGYLRCGVFPDRPGFAEEANATWVGMDVDLCRCLAVAIFDGSELVEFVMLEDPTSGYLALANDMVDVVAGMPYSLQADIHEPVTMRGYGFSPVYFYGEEGEMLTLVTNQDASQWSDFVRWIINGLIYAEESSIGKVDASRMPSVDLFGPTYSLMFKLMVLKLGNYGDIYEANLAGLIPRQGHNLLNDGSTPLINPLSIDQFHSN